MEKTLAQKIAILLAIVNTILFIPTTFIVIIATFHVFGIPMLPFYIGGCFLLHGYYQRAVGKLSERRTIFLWVGTILFNVVPLLLMACLQLQFYIANFNLNDSGAIWFWNTFSFFFATVFLAVVALWSEERS